MKKHKKGTSYKEIASIVKASPTNVSESLKFWKSVGILETEGTGSKPSQLLSQAMNKIEFNDPEKGWKIFRDALKRTWFVEHLIVAFRMTPSMTEENLFDSLGQAYGSAGKSEIAKPLRNLLQLLETSKIVLKDEKGNFTLNEDIKTSGKPETIVVNEVKDAIQIKIGDALFAIDIIPLKDFVTKNGKKLDDTIYNVG